MDSGSLREDLRRLRRERGLTQAALARRAGLSQQHLSLIESDPSRAELRTLSRILAVLGQTLTLRPAAVAAAQRRMAAWARLEEAESAIPNWSTPAADLARVGEAAALYLARHPDEPSPEERRGALKAWRRRLRRAL